MKTLSIILGCLLSFGVITTVYAESGAETEQASLTQLMTAISQDDYEAFLSNGTQVFKNSITRKSFNQVTSQLGDLARKGYSPEYLSELFQSGNVVHVWKISYTGSKEQSLVKLVLIDGKVAGFWIL